MSKRVVIVGAGVIGLCSAYYLARRGHHVTVLDRGTPEHENCSYGNAGMICPSHFVPLAAPGMVALGLKWMWNPESPFWIKPRFDRDLFGWGYRFWKAATPEHVRHASPLLRDLHFASRAAFEELSRLENSDFGLVQRGLLMLCKTERALGEEAHAAEVARALGVPAEVLTPAQTAKLDPGIRMDIAGAVYFPKDCHLSPDRFMRSLRGYLERQDVQFYWNREVTNWQRTGPHVDYIQTTQGDFTADEFVLCAGSWSAGAAQSLGLNLPMQAGKGYSLTLLKPRQLPEICAILMEARLAVTPIGGTLRFGGTMEIAGLNEDINPARIRGIIKSVPKYYPDFTADDFAGIKPWCGLRPCSPDGLPYVGRTITCNNLTMATGHATMGLSLGPATGRLVSEIVSDEIPFIDIEILSPDRYRRR